MRCRPPRRRPGLAAAAAFVAAVSLAARAAAQEAPLPDGLSWRGGQPVLAAFDGRFFAAPVLQLDLDAGAFFGQSGPGGFANGTGFRRARLGLRGKVLDDFEYAFIWHFGGPDPDNWSYITEAQITYTGLDRARFRLGAYTPNHLPDYTRDFFDLSFLERAAVSNVAASVASGTTRVALGLDARGERWVGSAYLTNGVLSTRNDGGQRGVVGRAAALLVDRPGAQLQLGPNGAWRFEAGGVAARFNDYPELRVDTRRFLDTGALRADSAYAIGPEANARVGPLLVEAVWQRIGLDTMDSGARRFDGWYVQGIYPLFGPARQRSPRNGAWARPAVTEPFDPAAGHYGALEIAGRYSTVDLRDGPVRGGRQRIWSAAMTWFPRSDLKVTAQYSNGTVDLDGRDRDFQAVALRVGLNR